MSVDRRTFLKGGLVAGGTAAALTAALSPLRHLEDFPSIEEFLRAHYKELTAEDKAAILERIREKVKKEYGVDATVSDPPPLEGVEFGYALNLGRCIGCRRCVYACAEENNTSRDPQLQYIRVLKLRKGTMDLDTSDHDYEGEVGAPNSDFFYMPVQCHQCRNAPCVKVCPVEATWQEPDGVVVIDYDWCIGCRYCMAACPYWARRFTYEKPKIPAEKVNPDMGYLSNRPRPVGVAEKCHFCLHRTRKGKYPACLEACPVGARKFGNLLDPASEVSRTLAMKRVYVLKEEVGTIPRFYYFFDQ